MHLPQTTDQPARGSIDMANGAEHFAPVARHLDRWPAFQSLSSLIHEHTHAGTINVSGLAGSLVPCIVWRLFAQEPRTFVIVCADGETADRQLDDLVGLLGDSQVFRFGAWGIHPYEFRHPDLEASAARLETLWALQSGTPCVVVTDWRALSEPTLPLEELRSSAFTLKSGDSVDLEELCQHLAHIGFHREAVVEEVGTFARRGGIVDFFGFGSEYPVRIELFGDEIESIRTFSVTTQRSLQSISECVILPRREVIIDPVDVESRWEQSGLSEKLKDYAEADPGWPAIEWLAESLGYQRARLPDYLPDDAVVWMDDDGRTDAMLDTIRQQAEAAHIRLASKFPDLPVPDQLYPLSVRKVLEGTGTCRVCELMFRDRTLVHIDFGAVAPPAIAGKMVRLREELRQFERQGFRPVIACDSRGQMRRLVELLEEEQTPPDAGDPAGPPIGSVPSSLLIYPSLHGGFIAPEAQLALLTDHEIFQRHYKTYRRKRFKEGVAISSYAQLRKSDYVVHVDYGVGRYRGLEALDVLGERRDCLTIEYKGGDKVFVPIEEFDRVQKFVGKEGAPTIAKLGGTAWEKAKGRAKKVLRDMADELIRLYAERRGRDGFAFDTDTTWQKELEASFPFEETPDQLKTIEFVLKDMSDKAPMDRLICGDVGYGKTEVAIRAALACVHSGKQVALLAPTTILAQQHLGTFRERLAEFPATIDMLSRFRSKKEQADICRRLKSGHLDVVIGTHRLLSKDIEFKDLGLLIVDEEHRFGVAHKERIRQARRLVDTLSMTATPIPRTLQMSLLGARDLSLIATSPRDRLPIDTEIREFSPEVVTESVGRELERGGQVFFVHNRVQSIQAMAAYLSRLLPGVRIAIAHGQMHERELERVMLRFYARDYDVLLSTAIIESGLDIPTVNTIIIHRADRFGLAQLYQLRGRVGRSARKAFAYLLTPPFSTLSPIARTRLKALEDHTALGSGFHLAMRDLEIRGAGNLLGAQQHGFIEEIGFDLYCRLLEEAVAEIRLERFEEVPRQSAARVRLELSGARFIPDDYIDDNQQRYEIYKRLAEASAEADIDDLTVELADRFGKPPQIVQQLLDVSRCRILAAKVGATEVYVNGLKVGIVFGEDQPIDRLRIERWRRQLPERLAFFPGPPFRMEVSLNKDESVTPGAVKNVLAKL